MFFFRKQHGLMHSKTTNINIRIITSLKTLKSRMCLPIKGISFNFKLFSLSPIFQHTAYVVILVYNFHLMINIVQLLKFNTLTGQ